MSQASKTAIFPPLPPRTKSFDFVEGDGKNAWVMRKVDLTGRAKRPKYHPELPQELRKEVVDQELPKPSYESGMTTVTFSLLEINLKAVVASSIAPPANGFIHINPIFFSLHFAISSCA